MSITNGYTRVTDLKAMDTLDIRDTDSDFVFEQIIEAASRAIDGDCWRHFYKSSVDETRYYTAEFSDKIFLPDDIVSITTLATDDDSRTYPYTWSASTDYDLFPYNAAADGVPFRIIEVRSGGNYTFPPYRKGVKIVGIFGWPAVPAAISQACLLLSARIFKRLSTPLGVASIASMGEVQVSIKDKDPDYWHLIGQYRRKV